mmetsp:Transcript_65536/g.185184  ORF Transcript_65536/g.185184 Transcript_65536/m.185184 type:complete len:402 (+) Transcript_65536:904-2109(+)
MSCSFSTFFTPREAAPLAGLSTAGKPTSREPISRSATDFSKMFLGVGSPASLRRARVACLFLAESTAAGLWPGRPSRSARRETRGTESSTKVAMPSAVPVRPSLPNSPIRAMACAKTASEPCDMSTGRNFATMPSFTKDELQESGCSRITTLSPRAAARSKMNLFPGRPAETKTMVAPCAIFLRRACASSLAFVSSWGGIFESIWKVAVGKMERMTASRSSADMGMGSVPGLPRICSASYFERCVIKVFAVARPGASRSIWQPREPAAWSSSSMTRSKSQSMSVPIATLPYGAGEAHPGESVLLNCGGDGKKVPSAGLCNFMASCIVPTFSLETATPPLAAWIPPPMEGATSGANFPPTPAKHPPQHPPLEPPATMVKRAGRPGMVTETTLPLPFALARAV